ncbi:DNA repair protein RadC [Paenibacillus curdlanolyticus YK9]|uniref:DNA repair protein RadC n=1 Tax=Paenibacillus curdlanolyticus YK9 TaxID=717606 RepID=E0ID84_9BACL|nr:JAB domain-containing protein [Paenibacillus curdlanolyticus]EFM09539.1 DNA repair protein RadC [Paenibacillus curdlanolyticus YK9]
MKEAIVSKSRQNYDKKLPAKRIQILSLRMVRESSTIFFPNRVIRSPKDAANLFRQFIGDLDREQFCILCLNTKNEPTALHTVSIGTLNASLVHPRETFKLAILANAASIIACHNHPSGQPDPSSEDIAITERLRDSGTLLGIELLDHLVLGDGITLVSMKERGLM